MKAAGYAAEANAAFGDDNERRADLGSEPAKKRNVLFVQESPCIRNYKMATALRKRGHRVTLAYGRARLSQVYPGLSDDVYDELIHLDGFRELWDIAKGFDVVHCHNEPDFLTVAALGCAAPVIHDTHELISLRANGDKNLAFFEGLANRAAAGRVYSTAYQMREAQRLYGVEGPSEVVRNYVVEDDLPKNFKPKLSRGDGQLHLVYEGGVGAQGHRDYRELFFALAGLGVHVHIHPTAHDPELAKAFGRDPRLHYHQPLSPKRIIEEMTQYDVGLIPCNMERGDKRFLDSTIANKLFEYLAAGLPVIASPLQSYIDYFEVTPAGKVFHSPAEAVAAARELVERASNTDFTVFAKSHEDEIWRVERLYDQVLGEAADAPRPRAAAVAQAEARIHVAATVHDLALAATRAAAPERRPADPAAGRQLDWDAWATLRYQEFYRGRPAGPPVADQRITAILGRYLGKEIETAVDLGCGQGQYADFLQGKGKMVLGLDVVDRLAFPQVRFRGQPAWRLDEPVDLAYAIDLLQHVPEPMIEPTIKAIADHCRIFFGAVALGPSGEKDSDGQEMHQTIQPLGWWLRRLSAAFAEVKALAVTKDWFWAECRHEHMPIFDASRMNGYQGWSQVTGQAVTPYRELWNRHARSLPWGGKVLYIGSNHLCQQYYSRQYFMAQEVLHIDPDPQNKPDVVTIGEDLSMFPDASVDGVAFFGTPYLMNDPLRFVQEARRVLKPGGLLSGSFNGPQSRWQGVTYVKGKVKTADDIWHFQRDVLDLFDDWTVVYWARQGDEYYHLSTVKM